MVKIEPLADSMRLAPPLQRAIDANARCGGHMGSFVRLHLDPTLLAHYESPGFNESTAVALDDLASVQEPSRLPSSRMEHTRDASAVRPSGAASQAVSTMSWMLAAMRTSKGDSLCRYRKGKCGKPRTLKKNGDLHSYCEFHRQRSIINQRKFDRKKREEMDRHLCHGCQTGGVCHDAAHASRCTSPRQSTQHPACSSSGPVGEKAGSQAPADGASKGDESRRGEECLMVIL